MSDAGRRSRIRWVVAHLRQAADRGGLPGRPAARGRLPRPPPALARRPGGALAAGGRGDGRIPSVAHPFLDLLTFFQEDEEELEGPLRDRLRDAYLSGWAAFEPPERLRRAWQLAEPLSALNQAISYRSIVADLAPVERHTAQSPAYWLRKVLAGLRQVGRVHR